MKDLGSVNRILGIDLIKNYDNNELFLNQSMYIDKILLKFNVNHAKVFSIPIALDCKLTKEI